MPKPAAWLGIAAFGILLAAVVIFGHHLASLLIAMLLLAAQAILSLFFFVVEGRAFRLWLKEVNLFRGPPLVRFRAMGAWINVGSILVGGGYVGFKNGMDRLMDDAIAPDYPEFRKKMESRRYAESLALWETIVFNLAWPFALLVCAAISLGSVEALDSFARGFYQFVEGALSPHDKGTKLLAGFFGLIDDGRLLTAWGVLAAIMAALNCLPVMGANGGNVFEAVVLRLVPSLSRKVLASIQLVLYSVFFAGVLAWCVALGFFLFGPHT
jgi:hypothetical protein